MIANLDDLRDTLNREAEHVAGHTDCIPEYCRVAEESGLPVKHGEIDMTSLPTWGEEPADTSGVWSYDATRLLVGDAAPYRIVPRAEAQS